VNYSVLLASGGPTGVLHRYSLKRLLFFFSDFPQSSLVDSLYYFHELVRETDDHNTCRRDPEQITGEKEQF
jgi:hypothetical protein